MDKRREETLKHVSRQLNADNNVIPTLPQVLLRVQRTVNDSGSSARDLAEVILDDPSLTASVLRLANSAYYSQSEASIRTVTSAIVLLGFETIRNLALGLSVYNLLNKLPCQAYFQQVWRHSLCCAVCAQQFARFRHLAVPEEAFVAGLLHDIGKLILGHFYPEKYMEVIDRIEERGQDRIQAENDVLGVDHMAVGVTVGERWSFPNDICDAIAHHTLDSEGKAEHAESELATIVALANKTSHFLFQTTEPSTHPMSIQDLAALCAPALNLSANDISSLLQELRSQIRDVARALDVTVEEWAEDGSCAELVAATASAESFAPEEGGDAYRKLQFLLDCSHQAAETRSAEEFLDDVIPRLAEVIDLRQALLLHCNDGFGCLEAGYGWGEQVETLLGRIAIRMDAFEDVAVRAFGTNAPAIASATHTNLKAVHDERTLAGLMHTRNIAAIPVSGGSRSRQVFVAARSPQAVGFTEDDLGILTLFAMTLSAAIHRIEEEGHSSRRKKSGKDRGPTRILGPNDLLQKP